MLGKCYKGAYNTELIRPTRICHSEWAAGGRGGMGTHPFLS